MVWRLCSRTASAVHPGSRKIAHPGRSLTDPHLSGHKPHRINCLGKLVSENTPSSAAIVPDCAGWCFDLPDQAIGGAGILPDNEESVRVMLRAYVFDRTINETGPRIEGRRRAIGNPAYQRPFPPSRGGPAGPCPQMRHWPRRHPRPEDRFSRHSQQIKHLRVGKRNSVGKREIPVAVKNAA